MKGAFLLCSFCLLLLDCPLAWAAPSVPEEETVRMGVFLRAGREKSLAEVRRSFDLWAQELGVTFQVPVKVIFFEDVEEMQRVPNNNQAVLRLFFGS